MRVPAGWSGGRTPPVISEVPFGNSSAIIAIASASRLRKNGNADSGQISTVTSPKPADCGEVARCDSLRYFCITGCLAA